MARGLLDYRVFTVISWTLKLLTPAMAKTPARNTGYAVQPPLQRFLTNCYEEFKSDNSGTVADYIPELKRADPSHFGVALVTIDGHIYEVGDSAVPFTIQSVSKAFVFALALELVGEERVSAAIGVEPSGEAFNSIRLTNDNRPFNPMVNAGAIACSGLIHQSEGAAAFECIREKLGQFAGRELGVDDAVHASEALTGNRNRAIAWLLRNYLVVKDDVDAVLDTYFRQCAILVTARDLAIMAGTLANRGVNPVTGLQVITPKIVARTLSVMTSSGMYDYAGEWIYRVGIPAKSGVGGGIVAALPSQIGLGTFSPCLDSHGNSVRGLRVCEALSSRFDLHMLNRSADVRTCIIADYDVYGISSRRSRQPHEQQILDERHSDIRVIELVGALNFAAIDYVTRRLAGEPPNAPLLILDFRRVPDLTTAGAQLLGENLRSSAIPVSQRSSPGSRRLPRYGVRFANGLPSPNGYAGSRCWTTRSNGQRTRSSTAMAASPRRRKPPISASRRCWRISLTMKLRRWRSYRPCAATRPASASSAPASPPTRCFSCRAGW